MMVLEDLGAPCSYDGARGLGMPRAPMMVLEDLECPVLLRWCSVAPSTRRARTLVSSCVVCRRDITAPLAALPSPRSAHSEPTPATPAERAPSREHVVPCQRRRPSSSAHRSRRRAHACAVSGRIRRAPTDVILTFSSVAALPSPRLFTRTDTDDARRASAEPRARRSLSSAADLRRARTDRVVVRSVRRLWPHRRAPTDVILTFSSVAALPSPRLFTRTDTGDARRASAEPRASVVPCPSAADLRRARTGRAVVRTRAPFVAATAERRPTSSARSAPLLLCPRRACSLEPTPTTPAERAPSRERASFLVRAPPTLSSAHRSCRRAQRAPSWPRRRAPTDVILTFSSVAALPSPRLFTRTDTDDARRASAEPRARRSLSAPPTLSSAHRSCPSCAACAVLAAPPSADRRHPHAQPRCCSALAAPVHSN